VLLVAAVLFMIGSVLCAAANGIELLLLGRVIQGLGAGGQLGLVNVTISDIVAVRYVSRSPDPRIIHLMTVP